MRSVKCDVRAFFLLGLLLPCLGMATDQGPSVATTIDADAVAPIVTAVTQPPVPSAIDGFGEALAQQSLGDYRGGTKVDNKVLSHGVVGDNAAINVATGRNSIADGAFAHAAGLPIVIQNSGANVLIQNSTIVNVQFR